MQTPSLKFKPSSTLTVTLVALVALLFWDASDLDLPLAQWFANPFGFPWRYSATFDAAFHTLPRVASWLFFAFLCAMVGRPVGPWRQIDRKARLQLVLTIAAGVIAVSLIKSASATSCPWDLRQFGGVAQHVSHWHWGQGDGGPGRCFPAGHASSAFAYLGGWFVFRAPAPRFARNWLAGVLVAGLVLGVAQQMRGAHYMSHTLWTAWICWTVAVLMDRVMRRRRDR